MRVVVEYDSGEIWAEHSIDGDAAEHLLRFLLEPPDGSGESFHSAAFLVNDLRSWCLAEKSRRDKERGDLTT